MNKNIIRREKQEKREQDSAISNALTDLHPVLQRVYATRHVQDAHELDLSLAILLPYQSLLGIDKAAALLAEAVRQHQRILIVGDFDADGATSTAVAMRALKSMGARHVDFLVPNRFAFGYGLTPELVEAAHIFAPELIVTVDNGIANHAGVAAAKARGIRVVITDHHLPAATLPVADAIVNPNQLGDIFPSKCLAGVGVIFYVMLAVRRHLTELNWFTTQSIPEPNLSRLLDLVALGTVADLVPLDHNNRVLVYQGLRRIRAGQCIPAIPALLELANREFGRASAADLGFAVAARLNAAGRLDDMSLGIACLLNDDAAEVRTLARTLNQLNEERRHIEQEMQTQALEALNKLHLHLKGELPRGLCLYDASWHQGVIGILASRIKDRYHRPVIVFAPGQAGELKGSARSIAGVHVRDILAFIDAQHPNLIMRFGGHAMAAGLTIKANQFELFAKIFNDTICAQINEAVFQPILLSDGELLMDELNLDVARLLRDAGPWGQAFPEPLFDDVFRVIEQRLVGDKHLKLRLEKNNQLLDAMMFFVDSAVWPNHRCERVRAAYRLDVNEYKGRQNLQLIVEQLEVVGSDM